LALFPMLIGAVLKNCNEGIDNPLDYDYTVPMLLFASLGVLALIFGIYLKYLDGKHHYGLEQPNIKADESKEEMPVEM
ncbi:MAG: hypothetical protein K2G59_01595, partial [Muribaculaceae bacterium]|nr:hypothetical protein [Muribaculaceae bacterium]